MSLLNKARGEDTAFVNERMEVLFRDSNRIYKIEGNMLVRDNGESDDEEKEEEEISKKESVGK